MIFNMIRTVRKTRFYDSETHTRKFRAIRIIRIIGIRCWSMKNSRTKNVLLWFFVLVLFLFYSLRFCFVLVLFLFLFFIFFNVLVLFLFANKNKNKLVLEHMFACSFIPASSSHFYRLFVLFLKHFIANKYICPSSKSLLLPIIRWLTGQRRRAVVQ